MRPEHVLLLKAYAAFNARDIDAALLLLHPEVVWPNGMEGGTVHGHDGVREYWTRQWTVIDPYVEPLIITEDDAGRVVVQVQQTVRDLKGQVMTDQRVIHVYEIANGLVTRMMIQEM
jgi:hypothetical protein